MRRLLSRLALLLLLPPLAAGAVPALAQQQQPAAADKVTVELNSLRPGQGGCQVFMIARNGTSRDFGALQADLVTFGPDGVVNGRLLVELAPLNAGKTTLRPFQMPEVDCAAVARVLLNEVARCEDAAGGAVQGCTTLVEPVARGGTEFFK